jgi:hypothetical protein
VNPKRIPIQAGKQKMLEGTLRDKNGNSSQERIWDKGFLICAHGTAKWLPPRL